ncbi:MAG: hypothetical protein ACK5JD_08790 [Mangrovibacterium sp.]
MKRFLLLILSLLLLLVLVLSGKAVFASGMQPEKVRQNNIEVH